MWTCRIKNKTNKQKQCAAQDTIHFYLLINFWVQDITCSPNLFNLCPRVSLRSLAQMHYGREEWIWRRSERDRSSSWPSMRECASQRGLTGETTAHKAARSAKLLDVCLTN